MNALGSIRSARSRGRTLAAVAAALVLTSAGTAPAVAAERASAEPDGGLVRVVSSTYPVTSPTRQLAATLPARVVSGARIPATSLVDSEPHPWKNVVTLSGVVMDVDFVTPKIGYAAAELGVIWKTIDGGETWQRLVNVGFPLYFYGVAALSEDEVVVSGFDNSGFEDAAIVWRTLDGGVTWSSDIALSPGWAWRVRYADDDHGLIAGLIGSTVWHTETGGQTEAEWTYEQPAADDGWIFGQFTLLRNLRAYLSGISFCRSPNGGTTWNCEHSVDDVFDGPTSFVNKHVGWVGGGSISPQVEGWLHRTTDGGDTWSGRVLETDYPIRHIEAVNKHDLWAAGGSGGVGGINFSSDGGQTWSEDLAIDTEITSCDHVRVRGGQANRIWCFGFSSAGGFHSNLYQVTVPRG